jgi:hypothetical protein
LAVGITTFVFPALATPNNRGRIVAFIGGLRGQKDAQSAAAAIASLIGGRAAEEVLALACSNHALSEIQSLRSLALTENTGRSHSSPAD